MAMPSPATQTDREVLAGIVERVTFHSVETGFCVLRVKARGRRDLATIVGHATTISAGEWITASGDWVNDREPWAAVQGALPFRRARRERGQLAGKCGSYLTHLGHTQVRQAFPGPDVQRRWAPSALRPRRSFQDASSSLECRRSLKCGGSCSDVCCGVGSRPLSTIRKPLRGAQSRSFEDAVDHWTISKELPYLAALEVLMVHSQTRPLQLASLRTLAKGLSPSHVCMSVASWRSPVSIMRSAPCAARTLSKPIQIAVIVRRSVET